MKKLFILAMLMLMSVGCVVAEESAAVPAGGATVAASDTQNAPAGQNKEFIVYTDKNARGSHFFPSGWIGDFGDLKLNDQYANNPHSGTTCIQFVYSAKKSQNQGWAGCYWQNPANNWGSKKGGFDLTGMNKLTFWARGEKGGELIKKFSVGGIKGVYPDSLSVEMGPVELTDSWKEYSINLAGKDVSYVNGAFCGVTTSDLNSQGCTFYLDDIKFEFDPSLKEEGPKKESMPFYVFSDSSSANNHFFPSGWMGDYGDLKLEQSSKEDPYLGDTCIKITYNGKAAQGARWAGMYWQDPPNNWATIDKGYDLSAASKLTFWARGAKGGERIEEFKVGGLMGEYSDSDTATIGPVILNKDWTQYTIDLKGKDMTKIIGGFAWATNIDVNPEGATLYLDEIKYE
ncbi:MAG: hypothetical protein PHC33_05225 [Candidatus Omnitrophica bacterium]|nr:hypothetical protein [Candidatus Omnitrophota bacterium]